MSCSAQPRKGRGALLLGSVAVPAALAATLLSAHWTHYPRAALAAATTGCTKTAPAQIPAVKRPSWASQRFCRSGSRSAATGAKMGGAPVSGTGILPPGHAREIGTQSQLGGLPIPFSPAVSTITNMYLDLVNGGTTYLGVYAGANLSDPVQGLLFVTTQVPATGAGGMQIYPLPSAGGIASLVSLSGQNVTVKDASGGTFTFDVQSRTWR